MDDRVATGVEVRFVSDDGVDERPVDEVASLLERDDGLAWVDIPNCDEAAARMLAEVFEFHPLAIQACVERNAVPRSAPTVTTFSLCCMLPSSAEEGTFTTSSWTSSLAPAT